MLNLYVGSRKCKPPTRTADHSAAVVRTLSVKFVAANGAYFNAFHTVIDAPGAIFTAAMPAVENCPVPAHLSASAVGHVSFADVPALHARRAASSRSSGIALPS